MTEPKFTNLVTPKMDETKIIPVSHKYAISDNLIFTAINNLQTKKCGKCYDLLLMTVHVMMLELGYLPIFKKTLHFHSPKDEHLFDTKNLPNNYVLPSGWDSSKGFYNLSYWHPAAELLYCKLVCVPLNNSLIIHAMIEGDDIIIDNENDKVTKKDADVSGPSQKIEDTTFFQTLFDSLPLLQENRGRLGFVLSNIFSKSLISLTLDLADYIENYDKQSLKPINFLATDTALTSLGEDHDLLYNKVAYQLGHCYKNLTKLSTSFKDTIGWPLLYDTMLRNALVAIIQANKSYFAEHHFKNYKATHVSEKLNSEKSEICDKVDVDQSSSPGLAEQTTASVLLWLRSMPSYVLYAARHNYGLPTFNVSALPPEVKSKILMELTLSQNPDPRHLVRVSSVNREFYALARQQCLWKGLCLIDFPDLATTFADHAASSQATPSPSSPSPTTPTSSDNSASDSIDWYVMYAERYKLRAKYTAMARARVNSAEQGAVRVRRLLAPPIPFHRHPHHHHNRYPPFYPMFPPYEPPFNHGGFYPIHPESMWPAAPYYPRGGGWPYYTAHTSEEDMRVVDFDDGIVRRPLLNSVRASRAAGVVVSSQAGTIVSSLSPAAGTTLRSIPVRLATAQGGGSENDDASEQQLFVVRDRAYPLPSLYYICHEVGPSNANPPDSETSLTVSSSLSTNADPSNLRNPLNVNGLINTHQTHANLPVSIYYPPSTSHAQNTFFSYLP